MSNIQAQFLSRETYRLNFGRTFPYAYFFQVAMNGTKICGKSVGISIKQVGTYRMHSEQFRKT